MIHIIQCLCPERHAILAVAYDDAVTTGAEALQMFQSMVQSMVLVTTDGGGLNPWCGICESRDWFYEDGVTGFTTLAEAKPFLEKCQADQMATRALIDQQKTAVRN